MSFVTYILSFVDPPALNWNEIRDTLHEVGDAKNNERHACERARDGERPVSEDATNGASWPIHKPATPVKRPPAMPESDRYRSSERSPG
jgi:hypothetical protein